METWWIYTFWVVMSCIVVSQEVLRVKWHVVSFFLGVLVHHLLRLPRSQDVSLYFFFQAAKEAPWHQPSPHRSR